MAEPRQAAPRRRRRPGVVPLRAQRARRAGRRAPDDHITGQPTPAGVAPSSTQLAQPDRIALWAFLLGLLLLAVAAGTAHAA